LLPRHRGKYVARRTLATSCEHSLPTLHRQYFAARPPFTQPQEAVQRQFKELSSGKTIHALSPTAFIFLGTILQKAALRPDLSALTLFFTLFALLLDRRQQ